MKTGISVTIFALCIGVMSCEGTPGPAGATGATGATGTAGADGADGAPGQGFAISSGSSCARVIGSMLYYYKVSRFNSGDILVECSVQGTAIQTGETTLWKSTQAGATTESCQTTYDGYGGSTGGWWLFSYSGGVRKAVYNDSTDPADGTPVVFATTDCSSF